MTNTTGQHASRNFNIVKCRLATKRQVLHDRCMGERK